MFDSFVGRDRGGPVDTAAVYTHTYSYTYTHTCISIYTYTYIYIHIYTYVFIHMYVHIHGHACIYVWVEGGGRPVLASFVGQDRGGAVDAAAGHEGCREERLVHLRVQMESYYMICT